jgi:hypothetical protein
MLLQQYVYPAVTLQSSMLKLFGRPVGPDVDLQAPKLT